MEDTMIILCGQGIGTKKFSNKRKDVLDLTSDSNWRLISAIDLCEIAADIYDKKLFKYILLPISGDGSVQSNFLIRRFKNFSIVVRNTDPLLGKWHVNKNFGLYYLSNKIFGGESLSSYIDNILPIKL